MQRSWLSAASVLMQHQRDSLKGTSLPERWEAVPGPALTFAAAVSYNGNPTDANDTASLPSAVPRQIRVAALWIYVDQRRQRSQ
jgi:hypothetical protein